MCGICYRCFFVAMVSDLTGGRREIDTGGGVGSWGTSVLCWPRGIFERGSGPRFVTFVARSGAGSCHLSAVVGSCVLCCGYIALGHLEIFSPIPRQTDDGWGSRWFLLAAFLEHRSGGRPLALSTHTPFKK